MAENFSTLHTITYGGAYAVLRRMSSDAVDLVVTSPPYPMIPMWDECFSEQSSTYAVALEEERGDDMLYAAHHILEAVWLECVRVLKPGGFLCINIGDAVRTLRERFQFFSNAAPIHGLLCRELVPLPPIIWRKPSNSPTKFLGSGMLPAGAYVTMEHEHILIFRKGDKRAYTSEAEAQRRRWSALFWEERNQFFSDLWTFPGRRQTNENEKRTGAFPDALPERLISMFSLYGDLVLDPFAGTGTTMRAAMGLGRSSLSVERSQDVFELPEIHSIMAVGPARLDRYKRFLDQHNGPDIRKMVWNGHIRALVKSSQEKDLRVIQSWQLATIPCSDQARSWEVQHESIEI